jgi:hypothetical protein
LGHGSNFRFTFPVASTDKAAKKEDYELCTQDSASR